MVDPEGTPAWITHFNAGRFVDALLLLEADWQRDRDDFHKGLIRMCAGLNQFRLGLDTGPQMLLSTARELLRPYQPFHNGLDLLALDRFLAACLVDLDRRPSQPRQVPPTPLAARDS